MKKRLSVLLSLGIILMGGVGFVGCGDEAEEQDGHVHTYRQVVVEPTCIKQGYTTYSCSCGDKYIGSYKKKKGHNFDKKDTCIVCQRSVTQGLSYELVEVKDSENLADGEYYAVVRSEAAFEGAELIIPEKYKGIPVIFVAEGAFANCSNLEYVEISSNIIEIEMNAFAYCKNLEEIVFSEGLQAIGPWAFDECDKVEAIEFPDSLAHIDRGAFSRCDSLTKVTINKGVEKMWGSFSECPRLNVYYKGEIADWCKIEFIDPRGGSYGYFTNGVDLYFGGRLVEELVIPNGVETIPSYAFRNCINLKSVVLGEGVKEIGWYAFSGCNSLEYVEISKSVEVIGEAAFSPCERLDSIKYNGTTSNWELIDKSMLEWEQFPPVNEIYCTDDVIFYNGY